MSNKQIIEKWKGKSLDKVLVELYIDQNLSMPEVAKELCVALGTVHKWLGYYGIRKTPDLWK